MFKYIYMLFIYVGIHRSVMSIYCMFMYTDML